MKSAISVQCNKGFDVDSLWDCGLSARTVYALHAADIRTIQKLVSVFFRDPVSLWKLPMIGRVSKHEITVLCMGPSHD